MKFGLIVYSYSGRTFALAKRIQNKLIDAGSDVELVELEAPSGFKPGQNETTLVSMPSLEGYDALLLATPTWGSLPAPPMADFLNKLPDLTGKRLIYLVTGLFPPNIGCKQTIAIMKSACEAKGAISIGSSSLSHLTFGRKKKAQKLVKELAGLL